MNRYFLLFFLLSTVHLVYAQDKSSYQFKKITEADFTWPTAITDSSDGVVVLADVGRTEFVGNDEGGFSLIYKRHKRVLIRKFHYTWEDDLMLNLEKGDKGPEKLLSLDITDNYLENGAVSEKKYDTKDQLKIINQQMRSSIGRSITYSQDCIVDLSYTIQSFYVSNLRGWNFQTTVPCLYSEYSVSIPDLFGYATLRLGSIPLETIATDKRMQSFAARKFAGPAGFETGEFHMMNCIM